MMITYYARKEPSTDKQAPEQHDVVLYRDREATDRVARYAWYRTKPDRRYRYVMHNCMRYRLEWLPDFDRSMSV